MNTERKKRKGEEEPSDLDRYQRVKSKSKYRCRYGYRNRSRSVYGYGYGYIIISSFDLTRLGCEYTKGSVSELSDVYSILLEFYSILFDAVLCNLICVSLSVR